LAVPILENETECLGIITVFEIVNFVVSFILKEGMNRTEDEIDTYSRQYFDRPVKDCLGMSVESQGLWTYDVSESLSKLFDAFSKGVHRILVTEQGKILTMLTQTNVLRYFTQNLDSIGDIDKPINEIGLFRPAKVLVLNKEKPALTGFALMAIHDVRAIPILDE